MVAIEPWCSRYPSLRGAPSHSSASGQPHRHEALARAPRAELLLCMPQAVITLFHCWQSLGRGDNLQPKIQTILNPLQPLQLQMLACGVSSQWRQG